MVIRYRAEPDLAEQVAGGPRRAAQDGEVTTARRVEVDHEQVGVVEVVGAGEPAVQLDHRLVGQVAQPLDVVDEQVVDVAARVLGRDGDGVHRRGLRRLLLEEAGVVDAVGEAVQHERPTGQVRQHRVGDLLVVASEVGLGEPGVGEQRLVGSRDLLVSGHRSAFRLPESTESGSVVAGLRRRSAPSSASLIISQACSSPRIRVCWKT